jgi:hypothetical protein
MKTNILSLSFRQEAATDQSPAYLVGELRIDGIANGVRPYLWCAEPKLA